VRTNRLVSASRSNEDASVDHNRPDPDEAVIGAGTRQMPRILLVDGRNDRSRQAAGDASAPVGQRGGACVVSFVFISTFSWKSA
jgi:hypothetical protein